jgi:hypothetical protein
MVVVTNKQYKGSIFKKFINVALVVLGLLTLIIAFYLVEISLIIFGSILAILGSLGYWWNSITYYMTNETLVKQQMFMKEKKWDLGKLKKLQMGTQTSPYKTTLVFADGIKLNIYLFGKGYIELNEFIFTKYYPKMKKEFREDLENDKEFELRHQVNSDLNTLIIFFIIGILMFLFVMGFTKEYLLFIPIIGLLGCIVLLKKRIQDYSNIFYRLSAYGITKVTYDVEVKFNWDDIVEVFYKTYGDIIVKTKDKNEFTFKQTMFIGLDALREYIHEKFDSLSKESKVIIKSDF